MQKWTFQQLSRRGGEGPPKWTFQKFLRGGWVSKSTTRTEPKNDNEIFVMQKKKNCGKTSGWLYVLGSRMSFFPEVSKCLGDIMSGWQNVSATQCPGGKMSRLQNVRVSKCLSVKMSKCQNVEVSKVGHLQNVWCRNV